MAQRRKQRIGDTATEREVLDLFHSFGWRCLWCGERPVKLTLDHVVAVARGGASTIDNLQPLCLGCNVKKGTNDIDFRPLWSDPLAPPTRDACDALANTRSIR